MTCDPINFLSYLLFFTFSFSTFPISTFPLSSLLTQAFLSLITYLPLFFLLFSTFPFPLPHYTFLGLSLILIYLYLFTNFSSLSLGGVSKNRELSRKSKVSTVNTEIVQLGLIFLSFLLKFQFINVVFKTVPGKRVNSPLDTSRHKSPAHYRSGSCATYSVQDLILIQLVP